MQEKRGNRGVEMSEQRIKKIDTSEKDFEVYTQVKENDQDGVAHLASAGGPQAPGNALVGDGFSAPAGQLIHHFLCPFPVHGITDEADNEADTDSECHGKHVQLQVRGI